MANGGGRAPQVRYFRAGRSRTALAIVLLGLLVLANVGVGLYTEWLWFASLGFEQVYLTVLGTRVLLFLAGAALFLLVFLSNAYLARRLAHRLHLQGVHEEGMWEYLGRLGARIEEGPFYARIVGALVLAAAVLLAIAMGLGAASDWSVVLRYLHAVPFGVTDPVFGQDVGFYVFTMPLLRALQSWLTGVLLLTVGATVVVYAAVLTYELGINVERLGLQFGRAIKAHLSMLGAVLILLIAANHILDMFDLLRSTRGVVYGASYADLHAELPALKIVAALATASALAIVANIFFRGYRLALGSVAVWLVGAVALVNVWPGIVQGVEVKPNELVKERPYILRNLEFTRQAFRLSDVQDVFFPAEDAVTAQEVRDNPDTISNIRLWDHRPLLDTLNQIQSIRTYYTFVDVDVDRYDIGGHYRQVMLSSRELAPNKLPSQAQTWVNQRLQYTHGYGLAMSLVNVVAEEGRPSLVVKDVPPIGELPIARPEIYYGENTNQYVIVKTAEKEFDYPKGDQNIFSTYKGDSGVSIGNLFTRSAYALEFKDANIVLSGAIGSESRILYRRNIRERLAHIAPFLLLDKDPYLVLADGQLYWMQDAYTVSNRYPYSQPVQQGFNYIRNSVKAVTNAYDGSVALYVADPADPIIRTYEAIFPSLFKPLDQMPAGLRGHIRYPEDLFRVQTDVFRTYHMTDPTVFYNREDLWAVPTEKFGEQRQPLDPYYVIMRVPGQPKEEFLLMLPMTPAGKDNMIAWLAGRSDPPNYGRILDFKYPKDRLIYGPFQVEVRIDQDPSISAQLTLWNQVGSRVIRGNLLVIPVGKANLYVEPLYLQAEKSPLPELKRVVVANGSRIAMEPTLEQAMARAVGSSLAGALPGPAPPATGTQPLTGGTAMSPEAASFARAAQEHYQGAQEALKAGDWARYGRELGLMEENIKKLVELAGLP